jgi:hypothetical protein
MIKSKINPNQAKDLKWKDYVKSFQKDITLAKSKGLKQVPVVIISDFTFACGDVHALILLGKQAILNKFFKELKADPERKKMKDYAIGMCHFETEDDGSASVKMGMNGFGKANKMQKNSKKLFQKLDVSLKEIIKGDYLEEVLEDIQEESKTASDLEKKVDVKLQEDAEALKVTDDAANDIQTLLKVVETFSIANKKMQEVIGLVKLSKTETIVYTEADVAVAEAAFRGVASLLDKYEEVVAAGKGNTIGPKIVVAQENIVKKDLLTKYELIWKKVKKEYTKQDGKLSDLLQSKFADLDELLAIIDQENPQK